MTKTEKLLLKALQGFCEDIRVAYIGTQEDGELANSALAHEWPDLCVSYFAAKAAMRIAGGAKGEQK